jgi:hypothetical protein
VGTGFPIKIMRLKKGVSARAAAFGNADSEKRKGLQLSLEPLNGRGIAGYVPEP